MGVCMSLFSQILESVTANAPIINAAYHRIIEVDFAKHHGGRGYTAELAKRGFDAYKAGGGLFFASETVLIIYREQGEGVEFHTCNAGTGRELTACVQAFMDSIAATATSAVTYYDNPQVSGLFQFFTYPGTVTRIDDGPDRTFRAVVNLKGSV